jgi:hypothetical protein
MDEDEEIISVQGDVMRHCAAEDPCNPSNAEPKCAFSGRIPVGAAKSDKCWR